MSEVHGDPVKPGVGLAPAVEPCERLVGADERLLRHVLGLRAIAEHVDGEPMDSWLVTPNELAKGHVVPAFGAVDKIAIGQLSHRPSGGVRAHRDGAPTPTLVHRGRDRDDLEAGREQLRAGR